ncbi:MAG: hypothetical protein SVU69_04725 [Pseudomonadota bacterium]|nr:hypothetical protein [Pseudomonadota bacterium]
MRSFYTSAVRLGMALITPVAMMGATNAAPIGEPLGAARQLEVAVIKGEKLTALSGQATADYSVMAVVDGQLAPIPYQFDDINERGFPYVPGGKFAINGTEGVLDAQDELVFMFKDTGPQASDEAKAAVEGTLVSELEVGDGKSTGYAYVVKGNSARSDKEYTHYDRETGVAKTDYWSLQMDPDSPLTWSDFKFKDFAEDRTILDTMKVRVRAKLGFVRATIHNGLIPNEVLAVKNGPVRSIVEADASITILRIPLLTAGADFVIAPGSLQVPVLATIPSAAAALSDLKIEISLDFHELEGAKIRSALGPEEALVTGEKSDLASQQKVDLESNWLTGSHDKGFDILATFYLSEGFSPGLDILYMDDTTGDDPDKPERYKGSHPQVGYVVSDIPTGVDVDLGVNLYFADGIWEGSDPTAEIEKYLDPVSTKVTAL